MKYDYTWNHIKLFADMCSSNDTNDNIIQNWVDMLETHHSNTYPFTLWPLTYKQSAVIASPSLISPKVICIKNTTLTIKFYASNDIMAICFYNTGGEFETTKSVMRSIKKQIMIYLMEHRADESNMDLLSIIFIGYGIESTFAVLMSLDIGKELEKEADFMEEGENIITVDCVTFSTPNIPDDLWIKFIDIVDTNINIIHSSDHKPKHPVTYISVGGHLDVTPSLKNILKKKKSHNITIRLYIDAILHKIKVSHSVK